MTMPRSGPRANEVTTCRKCRATIMFLQSFNQKTGTKSQMPVNVVATTSAYRGPYSGEVTYIAGEHQNHWSTCPNAGDFRSRR